MPAVSANSINQEFNIRGKGSPINAKNLTLVEQAAICFEMKKQGMSNEDIGLELGMEPSWVRKLVHKHLSVIGEELKKNRERYRTIELIRLEQMQAAIWPSALEGDLYAIDRVIKLSERRSKLLGLDESGDGAAAQRSGFLSERERVERIAQLLESARDRGSRSLIEAEPVGADSG